jgi:hypothetical protein
MPDPLLNQLDFNTDYENSLCVAEFYGVRIRREDRYVFLDCRTKSGQKMLARIDCRSYPEGLPDITFLNPMTGRPTEDIQFWPRGIGKMKGPRESGICIAGTATYAKYHPDKSALVKHNLTELVEIVILCCNGETRRLQGRPRR